MTSTVTARFGVYAFVFLLTLKTGLLMAESPPPRIFYTDLDSGPNTGGENNQGAFVTIYGHGFSSPGSLNLVTIGNSAVARILTSTDTKIILQLGSSATSGDLVVTAGSAKSNPVPFTVRGGNIYFVATNGNDGAAGTFASPWRTLLKARDTVAAGDIVYVRNGVSQSIDDGEGWNACLSIGGISGAAGRPIAFVTYPNETATIGDDNACGSGIRTKGQEEHFWTIAGFKLRGRDEALTTYGGHDWRVIANDMTCPNGDGASACYETSLTTFLKVYGNNVHDTGTVNASSLYHGVYFSTDSNHVDFGWNIIANVHGCRGLQVHSSPLTGGGSDDPTGHDQFDLKIHDNIIHDTQCDGIILATVDPSKGPVELFNNIIYNTGKGPNNPEGSGSWSCLHVTGWTNNGPAGSGVIDVYNNTLYACGTFANPPYLGGNAGILMSGPNAAKTLRLRNNILNLVTDIPYIAADDGADGDCGNCSRVYGANNLFYGSAIASTSSYLTGSIFSDPLFVSPTAFDFNLNPGSAAATGGTPTLQPTDFAGYTLPRSGTYPIGAYAPSALPGVLPFASAGSRDRRQK